MLCEITRQQGPSSSETTKQPSLTNAPSLNSFHKEEQQGVRKISCHRRWLCQGTHHDDVKERNVSSHCFKQLFLQTHTSYHTQSSPYCVPLQHAQLCSELFMIRYPFAQLVTIFMLLWWISWDQKRVPVEKLRAFELRRTLFIFAQRVQLFTCNFSLVLTNSSFIFGLTVSCYNQSNRIKTAISNLANSKHPRRPD